MRVTFRPNRKRRDEVSSLGRRCSFELRSKSEARRLPLASSLWSILLSFPTSDFQDLKMFPFLRSLILESVKLELKNEIYLRFDVEGRTQS